MNRKLAGLDLLNQVGHAVPNERHGRIDFAAINAEIAGNTVDRVGLAAMRAGSGFHNAALLMASAADF
jgi:hypothetical protein